MGSIVHRSVPTNLKWFPNCSPAHTLFQDRFQDVQVGSRWFSTLYILSPNFHTKRSSDDASGSKLGSNFSTRLGRTTSWSPRPMFYSKHSCENKAVAILAEIQAGRPTIIHKDGGEMLIAIVLDRPLAEAKALVDG